ncbi:MAG: tagaturonate epimerase family protein [Caldicoprobacterales bacterium]
MNNNLNGLPFNFSKYPCRVYPASVNKLNGDGWAFIAEKNGEDMLIVMGSKAVEYQGKHFQNAGFSCIEAPLNSANAQILRQHFTFTAPVPVLRKDRSFGLGDRLGIAGEGHLQAMVEYDAYPILAQQSSRELNLTQRSYVDVLDAASWAVFRHGYRRGFGADGDHLKKPEEVEYVLSLGFTMITLDCSEYIRNDVDDMSMEQVAKECVLTDEMRQRYLGQSFNVGDEIAITFCEDSLRRCILIYKKAIEFAAEIFKVHISDKTDQVDFEVSIDETATPTLPKQHYFVANELVHRGVKIATVAPRFCGEFQKGVDYIGDVKQFDAEMKVHAAIARHFGYKLSIHSGSDKFSVFPSIGKNAKGRFHVKTAGTSWLVAMQVVAEADPVLYRQVHKHALERFRDATKYYRVTTDIANLPDVDTLEDKSLPELFMLNDVRQLIHITYGFILTDKDDKGNFLFRDQLYVLWNKNRELYAQRLKEHIGRHLKLLYNQ